MVDPDQTVLEDLVLVWVLFYGPSAHFRSFRAQSVTLTTLILGKPPSLPVLNAHSFPSNWQLLFLNQRKREKCFHDQVSILIMFCTVCPDLSVRKLRNITVKDCSEGSFVSVRSSYCLVVSMLAMKWWLVQSSAVLAFWMRVNRWGLVTMMH